jgi:DNA-binding beta-propeller fold protein YncE
VAVVLTISARRGEAQEMSTERQAVVNAPEFPEGLDWLNTDRPLKLSELRGKVVLLDFWTYCCINCMHIIPDLKRLEAKYGSSLVVIGVHSAKFTTEQGTYNIRQAILRYGIEHPVVNDRDFRVWREYTANAWPTVVLIDTRGKIVGKESGEGVFDTFDSPIGQLVRDAAASKTLDTRPIAFNLERNRAPRSVLSFPGKVFADPKSDRLFISDSNHNRIVVANRADGRVTDVIGSGAEGMSDGAYDKASFNKPQGVALDGDMLYVADTENHAIRRVNLVARSVDTIAGNGMQAREFNVGGVGMAVPLNSPWDLVVHRGVLYVAMAGFHQIWTVNLKTWRADPFAGSGRETRTDGPLRRAALAQPSGIASDGSRLYVADSEVSSIRTVDLDPSGKVGTIVGEALFEFGDVDGFGQTVRLQHPLGIALHDGQLLVADTYNNKIKRVDTKEQESRTLAGTGEGGYADGDFDAMKFDEPGGLSVAGNKVYVADTNNHVIRVLDLSTKHSETLMLKGLERLGSPMVPDAAFDGPVVELPEQRIAPGDGAVVVDLSLAAGLKFSAGAPQFIGVTAKDAGVVRIPPMEDQTVAFPLRVAIASKSGATTLSVDAAVYYCRTGAESLCYVRQIRFVVPVRVDATATGPDVRVAYQLREP